MAKKEKKAKKKYTSIGGQALMEGIMMRGPEKAVMAARRMDGSITIESVTINKPTIWNKIPIIRGVVGFVQSMAMGTKMLMRSADLVIEDEENAAKAEVLAAQQAEEKEAAPAPEAVEAAKAEESTPEVAEAAAEEIAEPASALSQPEKAPVKPTAAVQSTTAEAGKAVKANEKKADKKGKDKKKDGSDDMGFFTMIATVLGFGLAILLFFFLPTWAYSGLLMILPEEAAAYLSGSAVWKSVIEGVIKMVIFFCYMLLVAQMKEIKRLFQYHGAEHKTIFCYEAGEELTVENVRKYKRFHPRCGTSFIVLMLIVGIAAGVCITAFLPEYDSFWVRPLIKLAFIPLTMGVGYELLKLAGKHDNIFTRIISAPGLWMQRISTKEPDDSQIECAIAAIKPVIPANGEDMQ